MRALPPSRAAVERAAALAGPDATVREVATLAGGTHARSYLIQTSNPELEIILREFPAGDPAARHEAQVLTALNGLEGLAPRLLASGPGSAPAGPWNLLSRLPGAANITPARPSAFAAQLGATLARIHATSPARLGGFPRVPDGRDGFCG